MPIPTHASQVFAFLRRKYRVSRNTRALWQFQQIAASSSNPVRIPTSQEITQSSDEIVLVSALDDNGTPILPSSNIICTSSTRFSYFTTRYKFAFILDMTDSCASVSIDGGHIYLESLTNCLCILLCSLAQTFTLPGCDLKFQPEIDISVYVYFPLHRTPSHQVLIHGYRLTWSTLKTICHDIINNLREATELLHNVISIGQTFYPHSTSSTMDSDDNINSHLNTIYSNSESSCAIINMLSYGITALQLMPEESTSALVIITDGILDVPNLSAFEVVMRQIRARIISCSFVQIGSNNNRQQSINNKVLNAPIASLGHVPNEELLKFISLSTFGSFIYFDVDNISGDESTLLTRLFSHEYELLNVCKRVNEFQSELLSWGFHKAVGEYNISLSQRISNGSLSIDDENNRTNKLNATCLPMSCKLVNQTVLQTSLENVLSLRLREGYTIRRVQIQKDEIEVHLVLPWRYEIQIYYTARSVWSLEKSIRTDIRVYKEAPMYFLQELSQLSYSQTSKAANMVRNNLIRRYNDVIQTVSVADRHLTLINTFSRNPSYYHVPDTIKRGKPIFYLTQNDLQQTLLNVKDTDLQAFADFWRPIVILDGSLWQRFMYTHNLTIILIGEVDRECFNTLVSFYFVKYLQERSLSLSRPILRAPRAITSDIVRVPFVQDTINLIRRSHQTHFDFSAFIDDYYKIKHDYINNNGLLVSPSLNSTLLSVLRERLCSKTYENKPHLFTELNGNNNAFTRTLISRSNHLKNHHLPIGLSSLKSNPYLLYLLNYNEQQTTKILTDLERYLMDMLFPHWDFLVCAESDEYVYMILLPKSERDLLLLNTDLNIFMHDLIAHYSMNHIDKGIPIYDDCRYVMDTLIDDLESHIVIESSLLLSTMENSQNKVNEEQTSKYSQRRRQRRDTFTGAELLAPHPTHSTYINGKSIPSSSPIPINHPLSHHFYQSASQPTSTGYRRIYSPLTLDPNNISHVDQLHRRYSTSAVVSTPVHHHNLQVPSIFNVIPPSSQEILPRDALKKITDQQWHIPIFLHGCNKLRLASSLLVSNEQQLRNLWLDTYIDYTKDDNESTNETITTNATVLQNLKPRKRDNSRRHDDETVFPSEKLIEDMRDALDYAFATAFYKNCLLDLTTHRSDVEYALNTIYQEHYEDIDLTPFLKAMCSHLSNNEQKSLESDTLCEPTTKHINSYLNEKFLEIIHKYFHRVSPDSEYFYFCTDEERFRQSRNSNEIEDHLKNNNNSNNINNNNNNNELQSTSGPYKFDETNGYDHESDNDDDRDSNGTVHIHDHDDDVDDDDPELQSETNRRRSDESASSLSNRSRELGVRGEILPLFIFFDCRLVTKDYDYNTPVKTIPLCISNLVPNGNETKLDYDSARVSFGLICLTFGREDVDSQGASIGGITTNTPTFNNLFMSAKRYQELNAIEAIDNTSTCTGTTMGGELNKHPLDKLRLSDAQRRAISSCRREIEWLLRDEQLSTYFTRRTLDRRLIENVIEHVQSSVNIHKSNCLCRSIDLMFVVGIDKSIDPFLEELKNIRIRNKYILTKCGNYFVLLEPSQQNFNDINLKRKPALSVNSSDDQSSAAMEDSSISDGSLIDDDDERKSTEDELDDYMKPSFWLFIERKKKTSSHVDLLEVKFYLYCGSSSDITQNSCEPQAILEELINEFNRLCRIINQKLLLRDLGISGLCNALLVPPSENDDTSLDADAPVLTANLSIPPGTFACDELWRHSFPLHFRLRPHLHATSSLKPSSVFYPGSLIRELTTHFGSLAVHNRKNLFVYCGERSYYYMRFREDTLPPPTANYIEDSLLLSDSNNTFCAPPSPQMPNQSNATFNNAMKNRQRHGSGNFCIHVMLYGLQSATTDSLFESVKTNLVQSIVTRLEDEVVKELVNALYHFAMTRLNPDDVTFIRPVDSEPKHIFEYKISPLINTTTFLYYFRRYVKTNQFHQPLLLPVLAKDLKEIIKDYRGQTLIVYNRTYNIGIPRPGLAWIELHVLNPSNRPSPLSMEDLSDEVTVKSLIDLIHIVERKPSSSISITSEDNSSENILRCHVWARGSQSEIDPTIMSSTLLQAFTFALADYVTELKLLPTFYNNQRHGQFEPPSPSPRSVNTIRFVDESSFALDRNTEAARTHSVDTATTMATVQSRRRQESVQSSILSNSSTDEPQSLTVEHANRLTVWFQYLSTNYPKLPSVTCSSYTLTNRILVIDIIHNFTSWLHEQKIIAYKHESLHGMIFRCNQEQTLYLPVPSLDHMPTRIPGDKLDLIVLYQSTKMINDVVTESNETLPQQESGDAMALANSSDIPKHIFLCIVASDKKLTMILYNAPDELSKLLTNHFSNIINWSNKRLNVLSIIVTQKMGLFRYRSFHSDQHSDYNRPHGQHGTTNKHPIKSDHVDLEQLIKETLPPKTRNTYTSWNIDLLYCNLVGSYPLLPNDLSQDLVQRHGTQLLQLKENKKIHMDRCTKLEEICSNWILRPKLFIADDVLTQMKHRSRLLTISVAPILFSRIARQFFQNNSTLRTNNTPCLGTSTPAAAVEVLPANRMANKRKSVAIPVDFALRRSVQSVNESDYQIAQNQLTRFDTSRFNNIEQQYIQITTLFIEQFSNYLQTTYKFHPINTKLSTRKIARSLHVQSSNEYNFHRSDHNRRATLLAELSSLNNVQIVMRFLQYDIIKIPINNQSLATTHFRQISNDSFLMLEQTELDAFVYDFHLQTIIRYQTNSNDAHIFPADFSLITFLQDFIEYYPHAPIGSKTALFKTVIHHQIDINKRSADAFLFKYILDHAGAYNIQIAKRNCDEYLFDCDLKDTYWMAARTTPSSPSELTVVLYIIYTNLTPKQQISSNMSAPALNKFPIPPIGNNRIPNSLKNNTNSNQTRERASTILSPSIKTNLVIPVRSSSFGSEQHISNNIPNERNVEFFKLKLTTILNKASLSHRRENLWERLIASRSDNPIAGRQEIVPIHINEFQALLDSCIGDETIELKVITSLLQRVFTNKEQLERLHRFLRLRYGSQFHTINSPTINYLVIFQCKAPHQCDAFLVLIHRSDQNTLRSYLVKHRNDIDCTTFIQTFTQRITYFLWECLV
ncbi:unnamed protein product [Rotaria sordida]|uniref:Uncharacterized protein n=2 Tax=Rotaria sordida TaxID=392033 RepID=A0A813MMW5_9BILA|nr:unnamed protein product [Rotaria sordida]